MLFLGWRHRLHADTPAQLFHLVNIEPGWRFKEVWRDERAIHYFAGMAGVPLSVIWRTTPRGDGDWLPVGSYAGQTDT